MKSQTSLWLYICITYMHIDVQVARFLVLAIGNGKCKMPPCVHISIWLINRQLECVRKGVSVCVKGRGSSSRRLKRRKEINATVDFAYCGECRGGYGRAKRKSDRSHNKFIQRTKNFLSSEASVVFIYSVEVCAFCENSLMAISTVRHIIYIDTRIVFMLFLHEENCMKIRDKWKWK